MEEATEVDMAATALLSDTPIQVSGDSVEIESSQIETYNGRIGKCTSIHTIFKREGMYWNCSVFFQENREEVDLDTVSTVRMAPAQVKTGK